MHMIGFQLQTTELEWNLALKRLKHNVSLEPKAGHAASKREYPAADREL